ncbi:cytochrome P450 87A3-like [Salvia splendens]|uniref:cytochrome P450 87A3-like n=1 Tax=Salvia splendens TaxID=180675 RepID=UPI001C27E677|nr:cytochrome P450 87A3-like [Salvia splendens]
MVPLPIFISLVVILIAKWVHKWCHPKSNGTLPPGSMGWPLLGETLHFFASTTSLDIPPFIRQRMEKYGAIFKTSLVGEGVIVSTDADLNYFIFQKEGVLFESWYPYTFTQIFGTNSLLNLHGSVFKYLKNMVLNLVGPESLMTMLPEVEATSNRYLTMWSTQDTVDLKETTAQMIFDLTGKKLISYDSQKSSEDLRGYFEAFIKGLISFPLNFPGTSFHRCLQGRKKAMKMLKDMLEERRQRPRQTQSDFFDYVLKEVERKDTMLTEDIALDLMFVMLFASYETTSVALTLAIKYLSDHPSFLQQLTEEHEAIIKRRENPDSGLSWSEYKSMKFTFQIINETMRLANIAPVIFRKALKDIKFKEYIIPAGWAVMVCPPSVHLDPNTYKHPLEFKPSRWEGVDTHMASRKFMVFGGGLRVCVGADFAKLQMAVFLHCLVTKYKWKAVKGGEIVRSPGLQFPNGYHINVSQI